MTPEERTEWLAPNKKRLSSPRGHDLWFRALTEHFDLVECESSYQMVLGRYVDEVLGVDHVLK